MLALCGRKLCAGVLGFTREKERGRERERERDMFFHIEPNMSRHSFAFHIEPNTFTYNLFLSHRAEHVYVRRFSFVYSPMGLAPPSRFTCGFFSHRAKHTEVRLVFVSQSQTCLRTMLWLMHWQIAGDQEPLVARNKWCKTWCHNWIREQ